MVECFDVNQLDEIVVFKGHGDLIEFYREGKYIYLIKPSEKSKRYFRFDLQEKVFERINLYKTVENKTTRVDVKNITHWFKDCRLVTKDLHFGRLVIYAKYNRRFDRFSSPVRFIEQLGSKVISNIEKWEALGVKVYESNYFFSDFLVHDGYYNPHDYRKSIYLGEVSRSYQNFYGGYLTYGPQDFNKSLLNHIVENYPEINDQILRDLHRNYNNGEDIVEKDLLKLAKDPEFADVFNYYSDNYRSRGTVKNLLDSDTESIHLKINIIHIMQEYNLNTKALFRWISKQNNVEKNDIHYLFNTRHYSDYLRCEYELRDGSYSKMIKYPENFRTAFHKVQVEYEAKKAAIDRVKFKRVSLKNKELEHTGRKFIVRVPETPDEINEEANVLEHCVRTYIQPMTNGETLILFLRNKGFPDVPFVTLEVKNGILKQAYGKNDSKPDKESLDFLKKWVEKKGLKAGCWRGYIY